MKRLAPLLLAAAACSSPVPFAKPSPDARPAGAGASATPPAAAVDAQAARRLVAAGVKVVDVRTPAEFAAGHLPGAVNIPYDEIGRRAAELGPPSAPVLLYCRSGRRSGIAARTLADQGFSELYDLGVYDLWVKSEPRASAR